MRILVFAFSCFSFFNVIMNHRLYTLCVLINCRHYSFCYWNCSICGQWIISCVPLCNSICAYNLLSGRKIATCYGIFLLFLVCYLSPLPSSLWRIFVQFYQILF
jgi:hypothetical protein